MDKRSKAITFTLTGHAHIDPVWLWDWREGYETVKATFRSALDRLKENPDMVFAHSSAAHYEWMEDHPALLAEVQAAVARGQWEPVGGWWIEPDSNIPSGEALARQGLYGQRYLEQVLGRRARIAFLPDSFGHPHTLPQIFKQCGLDFFVFMRPGPKEVDLPTNLFWWQGPDGSRVLTARVECYNTNPVYIQSSLERVIDWRPDDAPEWLHLYGVGNHGGGPTKQSIASIREVAADPSWPTVQLGAMGPFFERAAARSHPVVTKPLQHHARGCYSAYSPIKLLNRRGEHALLAAERWSALAGFFGHPYPMAKLTQGWRQLLFNQFHDIICGSSIAPAYDDSRNELGEALSLAGRAQYGALQVIAQRIDTRRDERPIDEVIRRVRWTMENWTADLGDGVPVVVFNPSPWPRREAVAVETNDWGCADLLVLDHLNRPVVHQHRQPLSLANSRPHVIFMAEVPPLGYRVYRLVDEPAATLPPDAPPLEAVGSVLENAWWRLEVDPATGCISSLIDKQAGLEILAGPGARLAVMADPTDAWGHGIESLRGEVGSFQPDSVELLESGPVRATLAINGRWGASAARQEISLYRESPAIHGRLVVNWQEQHKALKLLFPCNLTETAATYEVPFGHVTLEPDGAEEPLQQWHDVTGRTPDGAIYGVALLNDSKYGGHVAGGELGLTVLRSPVFAHHDPYKLDPNGRYQFQDQGTQELRWALLPHSGPWQEATVVQAAHDLNQPLPFIREYAHDGDLPHEHSFLTVTPPDAVAVTALKQAETGDDLILRLYEPAGRPARATVTLALAGAHFEADFGPNQIRTYRISRTGAVRETNMIED